MPALVTEEEALTAMQALPLFVGKGDTERADKMKSIYDDYRRQQKAAGKQPFENYRKKLEQKELELSSRFLDRETHGIPRDRLEQANRIAGLDDESKYSVFNNQLFRHLYGLDRETAERNHAEIMAAHAKKAWGEEKPLTDTEFYDRIGRDFETDGAVRRRAIEAGLSGGRNIDELAKLAEENAENPAYKARPRHWQDQFLTTVAETRAAVAPYSPTVHGVVSQLKQKTGLTQSGATASSYREIAESLLSVPPRDRDLVISAIIATGTDGDVAARKGYAKKLAESFGRGLIDYFENIPITVERNWALGVKAQIETGFQVSRDDAESPQRLFSAATSRLASMTAGGLTGYGDIHPAYLVENPAKPAPEVKAKALSIADGIIEGIDLRSRLRQIAENDIDPATSEHVAARGFLQAARSLPYTLAAITPAGFALNSLAMTENSYQALRAANPDMTAAQAQAIANVSGPVQAGLERISGKILTGRLPSFNRFANQVTVTRGASARRFATRLGAATGIEMVQESAQDITPFILQSALSALSEDVPDVDWHARFGDMAANQPELFFAVLPLALIGAGAGTVRDFRSVRADLQNYDMLKTVLGSEEVASEVRALALKEDYEGAQALMRSRMRETGADQKAYQEARAEAIPRLVEERERIRETYQKGQDLDIIPAIVNEGEGKWSLRFNDGGSVSFDSYEEADARLGQHLSDSVLRLHQSTVSTIRTVSRGIDGSRGLKYLFSPDAPVVADEVEAGRMTEEEAAEAVTIAEEHSPGIEREFEEAGVVAGLAASSPEDRLATSRILGSSVNEFRDGIVWTTMRLYQGHTVATVLEEKFEGDAKFMIEQQGLRKHMLGWLRDWDRVTGDRLILSPDDKEVTNRNLVEAWSKMGVSFYAGASGEGQGFNLTQARELLDTSLAGPLTGYSALFNSILKRAAMIEKAREDGTLGEDLEEFLAASTGMSEQRIFERGVAKEGAEIADQISGDLRSEGVSPESVSDNETTFSADSGATFSVLPAQDAEYIELAKDPEANREELQRMVDEAARAAGYDSPKVYHGTSAPPFEMFNGSIGKKWASAVGFWFTDSKSLAEVFGERVIEGYLRHNPKVIDQETFDDWRDRHHSNREFWVKKRQLWESQGFTSLQVQGEPVTFGRFTVPAQDVFALFNPNQIKSADPVTYDADGNVIPLSQRFDPSRDEISYSVLPDASNLGDEFARMFSPFHRSPELRAKLGQAMRERALEVGQRFRDIILANRTRANIKREADIREGLEYDRLLREVFGADTQAKQEALPVVDRQAARSDAKSIADKWRAEQEKKLKEVPREAVIAGIRTLDAITRALPAEVRGKIGGFVRIAELKEPQAIVDEIERRVTDIDRELEKWIRDEAEKRRRKLWKKARPKRKSGEKPKGKLGADVHDLFDTLNDALLWDGDKAEAHASMLEAKIASGELTSDQEAHAAIEANLVRLFSDWADTREDTGRRNAKGHRITKTVRKGADAARRIAAIEAAEEVWKKSYMDERKRVAKERERRQAIREDIRNGAGNLGNRAERRKKALEDAGFSGKMKGAFLSLFNFEQVVGFALGDGTRWARWFADNQREAEYRKIDEVQAVLDGIEGLFTRLGGSRLKGEKLFHRLSQPSFDTKQGGRMSEMEGLTAFMFWRQEDGKRHMRGKRDDNGNVVSTWSYDQSFIDEIAANLSGEAFAVLDYLTDQFAGEWETLNPIFRELNGINLPRHANYSPIKVKPQQEQGGQMVDPVTGTTMGTGSRTPGSLRTRAQVVAEPDFVNAVELFIAHKKEMAHWKAFAKFNTEAQAILGNREVSNSIAAKGGEEAMSQLRSWMDYFAQGGVRDAGTHFATNKLINRVIGRGAAMALVGRVGTLAIQSTQLGAAAAKMPLRSYALRMSKLLTGNLGWGEAMKSPYIQRRLDQMPPHVRIAMEGLNASNPTALKHAARRLGETLPGADALFTAGTFAMVLDYQYSQLVKAGVDPVAAREMASKEAERITDEVAQPTREGARSMMELTSKHPLAKLGWAFASEARKNLALAAYSAMNRPASEAFRSLVYVVALNGIMSALIRTAWRDLRDDEEDEDEWSLGRLGLAVVTEPLYGFPVFGDLAQGAIYAAAGEWRPSGTVIDAPLRAPGAIADILTGEGDSKDVETILSAMGLASESAAAAASLMHIYRDAEGVIRNFTN